MKLRQKSRQQALRSVIERYRQHLDSARRVVLLNGAQRLRVILAVRASGADKCQRYHFAVKLAQRQFFPIRKVEREFRRFSRQVSGPDRYRSGQEKKHGEFTYRHNW